MTVSAAQARAALNLLLALGVLWPSGSPRRDMLGRPVEGPQAPQTRSWTLWYEGEGEVGEDCDDPGAGVVTDHPCNDRLVRGPAFQTQRECAAAAHLLRQIVHEMAPDDTACEQTSVDPPVNAPQ